MSTGVVVVDMQPGFGNSVKYALEATKREVSLAIRKNAPVAIIQLNVKSFKETHEEIMSLLKGYTYHSVGEKFIGDGSPQAKSIFDSFSFTPKKIRVCGVYTGACVKETALGLARIYENSEIILVKEACCDSVDSEETQKARPVLEGYSSWSWIKNLPNGKISYKEKILYPKKKAS